ncbi:arf-GAP domain and FG repeat-containing protein 1-like [Plectropomus leopardus]|uniref:arf-GAP domain and FG repeat-containing protein 1-like n=1 Tax=Plectropomus leopardus TaxID=160734 RepID=UPI001C4D94FE|nr:arf-GAP domain and FG repeat-containing protein 1-like [Plectropomus leopardus]
MSNRKHRDNQEICARKVRELAQSGVNKHCFECNQPGVTYTDITVGSFVCTSCSGMLFINDRPLVGHFPALSYVSFRHGAGLTQPPSSPSLLFLYLSLWHI